MASQDMRPKTGRPLQLVSREERFQFRYPQSDAVLIYRRLDDDTIDAIEKKHRVRETTQFGMTVEVIPLEKQLEVRKDKLDYVLIDWTDVVDGDGNPAPCTRETKWALGRDVRDTLMTLAGAGSGPKEDLDPTPR